MKETKRTSARNSSPPPRPSSPRARARPASPGRAAPQVPSGRPRPAGQSLASARRRSSPRGTPPPDSLLLLLPLPLRRPPTAQSAARSPCQSLRRTAPTSRRAIAARPGRRRLCGRAVDLIVAGGWWPSPALGPDRGLRRRGLGLGLPPLLLTMRRMARRWKGPGRGWQVRRGRLVLLLTTMMRRVGCRSMRLAGRRRRRRREPSFQRRGRPIEWLRASSSSARRCCKGCAKECSIESLVALIERLTFDKLLDDPVQDGVGSWHGSFGIRTR